MNDDELRHIFAEIHDGRGNHGSFLRTFALTYLWADEQNRVILRGPAKTLVAKYRLSDYLSNFTIGVKK
jgi:hypothetical protein